MPNFRVYHSECLEALRKFPDNKIDALVTDPPAGIEFMGKEWDSFKDKRRSKGWAQGGKDGNDGFGGFATKLRPAFCSQTTRDRDNLIEFLTEVAIECFRVMKPGALSIDACRVGDDIITTRNQPGVDKFQRMYDGNLVPKGGDTEHCGRWPPHLLLTHTDECGDSCSENCAVAELDRQSGTSKSPAKTIQGEKTAAATTSAAATARAAARFLATPTAVAPRASFRSFATCQSLQHQSVRRGLTRCLMGCCIR